MLVSLVLQHDHINKLFCNHFSHLVTNGYFYLQPNVCCFPNKLQYLVTDVSGLKTRLKECETITVNKITKVKLTKQV